MAKFQGMPQGKEIRVMSANVSRTMTSATQVFWLPRGYQILGFILSGTASNAGTTATLSIGNTSASSNEYVNGVSVLSGGVGNGVNLLNGVAGAVGGISITPGDDLNGEKRQVFVKYAETGTASNAGAWKLFVLYTSGNEQYNQLV